MDLYYYHRQLTPQVWPLQLLAGEKRSIAIDWNAYCGVKSTSVSSGGFASEDSTYVSISGAASSGNVTSALFTASSDHEGKEYVTATATLANGEIIKRKFHVCVTDPESSRLSDYQ